MNVISDACNSAASCVDYPDDLIFCTERERIRPDEQRRYWEYNAVAIANGIDIQTLPVQDQPSNEALHLLIYRQRSVLLGEVDLNVRQDFNAVGPPHGPWTVPATTTAEPSATGQLIPNLSDYPACPIADVDHSTVDVRSEPGRPSDTVGPVIVFALQAKALTVQD